jgi:signal transduction histidine kinase/ActR/RegA family two-component response regulator
VPLCPRLRHGAGGWRWTEGSATNLLDDPAVRGLVLTFRDVTERKKLEEDLRQAQKMEAVGRLAGGVAHDFNNLLTVITGYSSLLSSGLEAGHAWRDPLEEIQKAADRAASLTRQLLAFSRKQVLRPVPLDLNRVIQNLDKMLRRVIREDVEIVHELAPDLWPVRADPAQLEQVLLTLVTNARDAMPQGGRVTVATANVPAGEAGARGAGRRVRLAVSDTGLGMDDAVRERLFEPFYTTKELGKGTGLGLASVYGTVQQSGGSIHVTSAPGRGSNFVIHLPAALQEEAAAPAPGGLPRGSETVLLVEDEEAIRGLARRVLEQLGYTELTASEGNEALAVADQHAATIHLLATDVIMPTLHGPELARRLTAKRPGMRVLYMSGYTDSVLLGTGLLRGETHLLNKPFTPTDLAGAVREALDEKPGAPLSRPSARP